jgi:hypothetical protein
MRNFIQCTISKDRIVDVGLGLTWLDVYKALDPYGVTVTGGRVPTVGVPGLLLGGGLSYQNSTHGFSCMGVVNYEVCLVEYFARRDTQLIRLFLRTEVLSKQTLVEIQIFSGLLREVAQISVDAPHPSYIPAAYSSLGIVTKMEMTAISNSVWAEARFYAPARNQELLKALMVYHDACEKDCNASLIWMSFKEATLLVFCYSAAIESPAAFQCFYDIPFLSHALQPKVSTIYGVTQGLKEIMDTESLM